LESAKTIGCLLISAIVRNTSGVNVPPTAATPMIAVGLRSLIADRKSPTDACACA
jgi:hypothetical protein